MNNTITKESIDEIIKDKVFIRMLEKTTICCLKLENGFEVVGTSSCVDKNNFDAIIGEEIAFENAKDKIWELEGYRLQCLLNDKSSEK